MKRRIQYLFALMCLCILGIISLQGYWLYNSYRFNTIGFRFDINDALENAVRRMVFEDMNTVLPASATDSQLVAITNGIGDSGLVRMHIATRRWYTRNRLPGMPRPTADSMSPKLRAMYHRLTAYWTIKKTIPSKIDLALLDSLFADELRQHNITAAYMLDTLYLTGRDERHIEWRSIKAPGFPVTARHQLLNPVSNLWVQAAFRLPVQYILRRMFWLLLATVLLIGCTSYCFGYMLHTILKQKKLSEIKNDFINNMTHELKTPITTVSAAVQALQHFDALQDTAKTRSYLDMAEKQLQRLSGLVEKVLDTAASEKEELVLHPEKVDLAELLEEVVNIHKLNAPKPVSFDIYISLPDPEIMADKTHLGNALSNLVDNAVKYSKEKAEISIRCLKQGNDLVIRIRDKGIGIPKAYQHNIFEKFFRVPTGNLHDVKGFGLGLSYVRSVIARHHGTVRVQSEEGKGTEFIIILPQ